jgi:hypothetical protein
MAANAASAAPDALRRQIMRLGPSALAEQNPREAISLDKSRTEMSIMGEMGPSPAIHGTDGVSESSVEGNRKHTEVTEDEAVVSRTRDEKSHRRHGLRTRPSQPNLLRRHDESCLAELPLASVLGRRGFRTNVNVHQKLAAAQSKLLRCKWPSPVPIMAYRMATGAPCAAPNR